MYIVLCELVKSHYMPLLFCHFITAEMYIVLCEPVKSHYMPVLFRMILSLQHAVHFVLMKAISSFK